MRKKVRIGIFRVIFLSALVLITLISCSKSKSINIIKIGILKHESSLPFYVADELGLFSKNNIQVELIEVPPGDHMPALLSNRVDIISPTSFPVLFGVMLEHPNLLYAVFPGAEVFDGPIVYGIIVKSTNECNSVHDLKGEIIMAINPYTQVNIQMILNSAKISKSDWPEIRIASRESALQAVANGAATAAIMDQPALATALSSEDFRLLEANPRAKYIGSPYWSGAGAVKRETWLRRRIEFINLMTAFDDSIRNIQSNPLDAHKILARRMGLDQEIASQCGGYYFPLSGETVPKSGIENTIGALKDAGLLENVIPLGGFFPPNYYGEK